MCLACGDATAPRTACRIIELAGPKVAEYEAAAKAQAAKKEALAQEASELASQIQDLETEKEIQAGGEMAELRKAVDDLQMQ